MLVGARAARAPPATASKSLANACDAFFLPSKRRCQTSRAEKRAVMFADGVRAAPATSMSSTLRARRVARMRSVPGLGPATYVAVPAPGFAFAIDAPDWFYTSVNVTPAPPTAERVRLARSTRRPSGGARRRVERARPVSEYDAVSVAGVADESVTDTSNVYVPSGRRRARDRAGRGEPEARAAGSSRP